MKIRKLIIENFRNIKNLTIKPSTSFNIFYGLNGSGKTNLIESIYLLSSGRSFKTYNIIETIMYDEENSIITVDFEDNLTANNLSFYLNKNQKRIILDETVIKKIGELFGVFPVVMFSSTDILVIRNNPEYRRKFLDRLLYNSNPNYLKIYQKFYRILKHRNEILKSHNLSDLDIWTEQLAVVAVEIIKLRSKFIENMYGVFKSKYEKITNCSEEVKIKYKPDINVTDVNSFLSVMDKNKVKDINCKNTSRGPHRDDLIFLLNDLPLKLYGSQGQCRSFILALKLAEIEYLYTSTNKRPVVLLDDISSELDNIRIKNLLNYLEKQNLQTFITTTEYSHLNQFLYSGYKIFNVANGSIIAEKDI